jgi:16S rRNA (uracil1498-N3)-methyltransferase
MPSATLPTLPTTFLEFCSIMTDVKRRFHVRQLRTGFLDLDPSEAHHVRDVLRLTEGTVLELFDDAGRSATGPLVMVNPTVVRVEIIAVDEKRAGGLELTVAAAIPKGDRADWMIEKLSELGVSRFIPLAAERSVVLPAGRNKFERWERIAMEAAKQSRRAGNLNVAELTPLSIAITAPGPFLYLSTAPGAIPIGRAIGELAATQKLTLLIGPEGGWSDQELKDFSAAGIPGISLTRSILRMETAAIAAAAIVLCERE